MYTFKPQHSGAEVVGSEFWASLVYKLSARPARAITLSGIRSKHLCPWNFLTSSSSLTLKSLDLQQLQPEALSLTLPMMFLGQTSFPDLFPYLLQRFLTSVVSPSSIFFIEEGSKGLHYVVQADLELLTILCLPEPSEYSEYKFTGF